MYNNTSHVHHFRSIDPQTKQMVGLTRSQGAVEEQVGQKNDGSRVSIVTLGADLKGKRLT